jgi:hypothetical protein
MVLVGQILLYTCPWWTRMRYYVDLSYRCATRLQRVAFIGLCCSDALLA